MPLTRLLFRVYMCEGPREYTDHHGIVFIFGYDICFIIKKVFKYDSQRELSSYLLLRIDGTHLYGLHLCPETTLL